MTPIPSGPAPRRAPALALLALLAAVPLGPAPLGAQAPVVTLAGDPSVRSDTIYRLAGKPADHPNQSQLVLLDDGIVRLEADGRGSHTYRQVVQILTEDAVARWQEHSFSWVPARQRLRVNWFRVLRPDGTVVSARPSQVRDADVPAEMRDPVYTDTRVRRLSVSGVAVGTIVDFSYTTEDLKPFPSHDAFGQWSVSMGAPVRRSRLVLDVPAGVAPTIVEDNLRFARRERVAAGRRVYTWATADVQEVKVEPYAADSNGVFARLAYALPRTWRDVGAWYGGLTKDRYALDAASRAKAAEAAAGARTREDTLRALHRWVAQDVRYVSVALGRGGYVPRTPAEVVRTGFGDCKDKATLFVAALRAWGIRAHPVILRAGPVDRRLPTVQQFNHAIAAVEAEGGYRFVDLTAAQTPWGELPYAVQGEFALVVRDDGRVDEVTIPREPVAANRNVTAIVGELAADGTFRGRYEEQATGVAQYALRGPLETPLDSTRRAQLTRALAGALYPGAEGDSLVAFVGRDLTAQPRVSFQLRGGRAARPSGTTMILALPMRGMEAMAALASRLEAEGPRRFPIDAEQVLGPVVREQTLRVTLPAGWTAQLPEGVRAVSAFGEYEASFTQEGRDLIVRRRMAGARGVHPPEQAGALVAWLRAMGRDDAQFVVVQTAAAAQAPAAAMTPPR